MTKIKQPPGVFCPVITPYNSNLDIDLNRLTFQCNWLVKQNVGITLFGTTSEANSLSIEEKIKILNHLKEKKFDFQKILIGTGCCALPDTVRLTSYANYLDCLGCLLLPPFYYKNITDEGIYQSIAETISRVREDSLRLYLYHIPHISGVSFSINLIEKLLKNFEQSIAGIKDSSGDWQNTENMLRQNWNNFKIYVGNESFLLKNMQHGGDGCISATANINPKAIKQLYLNWEKPDAQQKQEALNVIRNETSKYPLIPAIKAILAEFLSDDCWRNIRPPLNKLDKKLGKDLTKRLREHGLEINLYK